MTISTVLEQDPFLLMYELCGKNQHLIYMYTHVHLYFASAEPVRALSLQACTHLSSNQWLNDVNIYRQWRITMRV